VPDDDGVRESDVSFQRDMQREIKSVLKELKIEYTNLTGPDEQRLEIICQELGC